MATVTHAKNVAIADDPKAAAAGEVLPSDWNADHVLTGFRTMLVANTNYYVSAGGSDANGGTNSSSDAWATIQHALNFIAQNIDIFGFTITINVGAGTFLGANVPEFTGGGIIQVFGAGPSSTTIQGNSVTAGKNCFQILGLIGSTLQIDGVTLDTTNIPAPGTNMIGVAATGVTIYVGGFGRGDPVFKPGRGTITSCILIEGNSVAFLNGASGLNFDASGTGGDPITGLNPSQGAVFVNFGNYVFLNTPNFGTPPFQSFILSQGDGTLIDFGGFVVGSFTGCFLCAQWGSSATLSFVPPSGTVANLIDSTSTVQVGTSGSPDPSDGGVGSLTISGAPTTGQLPLSTLVAVIKDSGSGAVFDCYNDGGTIKVRQIGRNIVTQTSTNYTLVLTDQDGRVEMNNAVANTVTVPSSSTVLFPTGTEIRITQTGAGATTVTLATTTMTSHNFGALSGQWATSTIYKRGADEWVQTGT